MMLPKELVENAATESAEIDGYLRYVTLNVGFDGLFVRRTPREMIEGYEDGRVEELSRKNLFVGGLARGTARFKLGRLPEKSRVTLLMGNESSDGEADAR